MNGKRKIYRAVPVFSFILAGTNRTRVRLLHPRMAKPMAPKAFAPPRWTSLLREFWSKTLPAGDRILQKSFSRGKHGRPINAGQPTGTHLFMRAGGWAGSGFEKGRPRGGYGNCGFSAFCTQTRVFCSDRHVTGTMVVAVARGGASIGSDAFQSGAKINRLTVGMGTGLATRAALLHYEYLSIAENGVHIGTPRDPAGL